MYPCIVNLNDRNYREVSNISHTLVDNKIVDHSDLVGASPVGAAPTTSAIQSGTVTVSKIRKDSYRSDVQVTFKL